MNPLTYTAAATATEAVDRATGSGARYLGGGTNLVDLLRRRVERPATVLDVSRLPGAVEETADGGLRIGAALSNAALAADPLIRRRYPLVARAVLAGASPQIRNMATVGGNLLQRTRCPYFADVDGARCNKRSPGDGCDARDGSNRYHAILGASPACVATHPSDLAVSLVAVDATVELLGADGVRTVPVADLYVPPGDRPDIETVLEPGELITALALPPLAAARRSTYRKVRDRSSYAFALVSLAAAVEVDDDGVLVDVRLALGGVAHRPWRCHRAEEVLRGHPPSPDLLAEAAGAELGAARPLSGNGFKVELARRLLAAVTTELSGARP